MCTDHWTRPEVTSDTNNMSLTCDTSEAERDKWGKMWRWGWPYIRAGMNPGDTANKGVLHRFLLMEASSLITIQCLHATHWKCDPLETQLAILTAMFKRHIFPSSCSETTIMSQTKIAVSQQLGNQLRAKRLAETVILIAHFTHALCSVNAAAI